MDNPDPLPRQSEPAAAASDTTDVTSTMDNSVPVEGSNRPRVTPDENSGEAETLMDILVRMSENQNKLITDVAKLSGDIEEIREETDNLNEAMMEAKLEKFKESDVKRNVKEIERKLDIFGVAIATLQKSVWYYKKIEFGAQSSDEEDTDDSGNPDGEAAPPRKRRKRHKWHRPKSGFGNSEYDFLVDVQLDHVSDLARDHRKKTGRF
jgi:hypothetical protein